MSTLRLISIGLSGGLTVTQLVSGKASTAPAMSRKSGIRLWVMGGLVHSQRVLLALTQAGLSREDAYALVQRNAMKVWESDGQLSLLDLLRNDPEVTGRLSGDELEALFNLDYHFKEVDTIFDRVFGAA